MKITAREKVTKGWKVTGRDATGRIVQLSRRYHSKVAADEFAKLAEAQGIKDVTVRTIMAYER